MKIRKGFVSNSSSSSFLVAFDKVPDNAEELKIMMFGDEKYIDFDGKYKCSDIATTVFGEMKGQKSIDENDVLQFIKQDGNYYEFEKILGFGPWLWFNENEENKVIHERMQKEVDKLESQLTKEKFDKFMKLVKRKRLFEFHYSDNDGGYWSMMEHGEIFDKLTYYQRSEH